MEFRQIWQCLCPGWIPVCGCLVLAVLVGCVPEDGEPTWRGSPCDVQDIIQDFPGEPYGDGPCDTIENACFAPANAAAVDISGIGEVFSLSDLFADESIQGVLLFGTAGWCPSCNYEVEWLNSIYPSLQDIDGSGGRIEVVAVIFQDDWGGPADKEYAELYAERKNIQFPAVADTVSAILNYFEATAAPGNIFINRENMKLTFLFQSWDQSVVEREIEALGGSPGCQ